jgi:hypothetical protein
LYNSSMKYQRQYNCRIMCLMSDLVLISITDKLSVSEANFCIKSRALIGSSFINQINCLRLGFTVLLYYKRTAKCCDIARFFCKNYSSIILFDLEVVFSRVCRRVIYWEREFSSSQCVSGTQKGVVWNRMHLNSKIDILLNFTYHL